MLKRVYKKLLRLYKVKILHKTVSSIKIEEWRKNGIVIGEGCIFCSELPIGRDSCLLEFGNNVLVSSNVTFLMHDAAPTTVSNGMGTDILGKVKIGDTSFIGAHSIIMPGVSLANNTVVGSGSVVTYSINKPGYVIAGNPAKVICSVEDYLKKNKDKIVNLNGMSSDDIKTFFESHPEKLISKSNLL